MSTEDDIFQDNSPAMVDCDVLEAAKENVQPLATGRRVTALSAILSTPHAHREAKLSATRNRLRINIELALEDDDDDPLEAYSRLVYWTVENYPQGHSAESGLVELLEEATRVLKDNRDGRWRGELKYLKLWLLYASYVEKPTIIYKFLIANEIGTNFALLYEEFAAVLERDGRRKEADDAYALGIARRASPLDHLQSRHSDFQKRMMCSASATQATPTVTTSSKSRTILASTSSSSRLPSTRGGVISAPSAVPSGSNRPMQIFVDDPSVSESTDDPSRNAWPEIGTRKTRIKENVPEVKKLAGTTLKQAGRSKRVASGASSAASASKIIPFRDPDPAEIPPTTSISKKTRPAVENLPTRGTIVPFVDPEGKESVDAVPATPKFTPFRDEIAASSLVSAAHNPPETIIKLKKTGTMAPIPTSEAEELRRDPLKNYVLGAIEAPVDG
ncbi:Mad3/BUB1 homology region 1-domain-containing protein [Infundibulicybe gibba]|nr:Mad3/BUB1 homology region 1-domain-containing protein [Infundibulicybe gibba]